MSKKDVTALVRGKILPYFNYKLPTAFGRSAQRMVVARLRADGDAPEGVADEVLLCGCNLMIGYLEGGGKVDLPESLFTSLCCTALEGIREERARQVAAELMRLLEGEVTLEDSPVGENTKILNTVRQALVHIPDRFAHFLRLDLLERRSEGDIREELGLPDREMYLHLKRLSLTSLRRAIERLLRG